MVGRWLNSTPVSNRASTDCKLQTPDCTRLGLKLQTSEETNGDEYIRLETSTYEWVLYRRRVHTNA